MSQTEVQKHARLHLFLSGWDRSYLLFRSSSQTLNQGEKPAHPHARLFDWREASLEGTLFCIARSHRAHQAYPGWTRNPAPPESLQIMFPPVNAKQPQRSRNIFEEAAKTFVAGPPLPKCSDSKQVFTPRPFHGSAWPQPPQTERASERISVGALAGLRPVRAEQPGASGASGLLC